MPESTGLGSVPYVVLGLYLGVLLCFTFYSCVKAGQALGWNQILTPWLGAWIANLAFAGVALVLMWKSHK